MRLPGGRELARALAPALGHLGVRGLGLLALWALSAANDRPFSLHHWDAGWYMQIAAGGYDNVDAGMTDSFGVHHDYTAMVFFPGYPQLLGLVAPEIPGPYVWFAAALSTALGVLGAYGVVRFVRLLGGGRRAGLTAVALVAGAPMSVVYSMPYPESLLIAAVVWGLVALLERRWLLAGACAAGAGYTHPMGAPLVAVVAVAGLLAAYRGQGGGWRPALAAVAAPAGLLGYLVWVQLTSGVPGGYFAITRDGWRNDLDLSFVGWIGHTLATEREAYSVLTALLCVAAVLALVAAWRRLPWPVWVYTALTIALAIGHSGAEHDRVRQLLSAFPILVLLALWLARQRAHVAAALTAGIVTFGLWFSAYALVAQPHSI